MIYDRDEQITHAFDLVVRAQQALSGSYAERLEAGLALAPPVPAAELHHHHRLPLRPDRGCTRPRAEWLAYVRLTALALGAARAPTRRARSPAGRAPARRAPAPAARRRTP
ncbi:MAG: hypothetical protein HS111_13470 [Kofleriaceae bacterium]|nr:hypothetical protein [Kofleriaceae bacterium]